MNKTSFIPVHFNDGFILAKLILFITLLVMLFGCANQQQAARNTENLKARARAHSDLGAVYYQQKKYDIALEEFTEALKIDPTFGLAYNGLGLVHSALGEYELAESNFKKAIQIEPNNSESHNNYGGFLCERNRIDESLKEFEAAVKNPLYVSPSSAYANAGICSLRRQDELSAEKYFKQALQVDPLYHFAAYQLATIQFKRKDPALAKKTLQNAVLVQPNPEVLWLAIQIERAVGSKNDEASYALELRRRYPDSEQAKLLQSGQ